MVPNSDTLFRHPIKEKEAFNHDNVIVIEVDGNFNASSDEKIAEKERKGKG